MKSQGGEVKAVLILNLSTLNMIGQLHTSATVLMAKEAHFIYLNTRLGGMTADLQNSEGKKYPTRTKN
jgi:hypothetical protein